jgi:hypothetical protein
MDRIRKDFFNTDKKRMERMGTEGEWGLGERGNSDGSDKRFIRMDRIRKDFFNTDKKRMERMGTDDRI